MYILAAVAPILLPKYNSYILSKTPFDAFSAQRHPFSYSFLILIYLPKHHTHFPLATETLQTPFSIYQSLNINRRSKLVR